MILQYWLSIAKDGPMTTINHIRIDEVNERLPDDSILLIDVRNLDAYQAGHLTGAIHLNKNELDSFAGKTDKSQAIIFYCYHGISCHAVAQYFADQGFTNIYSMDGGFEAWRLQYPVARAENTPE